ncbi:MAG TPA: [Fe-Fe] hydrogenase large subunit C-terminal domain-containing protein [Candidatus Brocadiia bacterium]|nr:[Fe-Fe] hydrogenase large subunit C-terminal domain-containing protein [Candidatus Brocadiia bacterium]
MGIVSTIPEKCKRCYTCVRECPAKAIKVEGGQATVIEERCIACGNCVKVCAQKAKLIEDNTRQVREMLDGKRPVFACIAPSFPAAFHPVNPGNVIAGVRRLGFAEVWEVAFGAELTSRQYLGLFESAQRQGRPVIATPCPAIVAYVEKYMPALREYLAPIVSPMIALARVIRRAYGSDVRIVFIGPCIAKKDEIRDPCVAGAVDAVLTFEELLRMFCESSVSLNDLQPSGFDGLRCRLGRSFPISGGLLRSAGLSTDILENNIIVVEGKDRALDALHELQRGKGKARFFDILLCEGCINGPKMMNDLSVFARKEILADYINDQNRYVTQKDLVEGMAAFSDLDLGREFHKPSVALQVPDKDRVEETLKLMKKFSPDDQLNCGACGYPSCREKAIAVCQGLAEPEMCLPYLVDELQGLIKRLERSHNELAQAQQRLVQTEKLASMGQLSAGVAHEINNPLGTILLYSHIMLKQLQDGDPRKQDLQMIVKESTRCKDIVRGLLDFGRQSRVSKTLTDLKELVAEVILLNSPKANTAGVKVKSSFHDPLPQIMLDSGQIKQMLTNLINNAVDATPKGGLVTVGVTMQSQEKSVEIAVADSGCGIPRENLSKLFTPFFTTKQLGKGTGLGLAIVYGIVKMHNGDIRVDSEVGKGTTFTVSLPAATEDAVRESGPAGERQKTGLI